MARIDLSHLFVSSAVAAVIAGAAGITLAQDFHVENRAYAADQKTPASRSITIFQDNMVYDCLSTPAETVVFDKAAGRFVLLQFAHKVRCELLTSDVMAFNEGLRLRAVKSKDPVARFLAEPKFDEHSDNGDELTLTSPLVTYRITMVRESDQSMVEQYRDFCDWYARLNALLIPGPRPPFARLAANAALAQRKAMASQIALTVATGKGLTQKTTIRSEHEIARTLDQTDLERVAQARAAMENFKPVGFEQYRKLDSR